MENKYTERQEQIAKIAKAMGHPVRIAILEFLAQRDSCFFGDINEILPIAKATVSQHLKELKAAGLIKGEIEKPKVRYCIDKDNCKIANIIFSDLFKSCNTNNDNSCSDKKPCQPCQP